MTTSINNSTHSLPGPSSSMTNTPTPLTSSTLSSVPSTPGMIGSKPTLITKTIISQQTNHQKTTLKFLIMDAPRNSNLHLYIKEFDKQHVTDVVRVCEPTYNKSGLVTAGIQLHEMPYSDGHSPPQDVLDRWLRLVDERWFSDGVSSTSESTTGGGGGSRRGGVGGANTTKSGSSPTSSAVAGGGGGSGGASLASVSNNTSSSNPCIAVHCVAGLGRAPVLVAIALIEFAGMDPVEAVTLIRKHRRGAINEKQLNWLEQYQRTHRSGGDSCCVVM